MIENVVISDDLISYLESRSLQKQYRKCKDFLLSWNFRQIDFKIREPRKDKVYYFRINKQFRALCKIQWTTVKVFDIDNHQN